MGIAGEEIAEELAPHGGRLVDAAAIGAPQVVVVEKRRSVYRNGHMVHIDRGALLVELLEERGKESVIEIARAVMGAELHAGKAELVEAAVDLSVHAGAASRRHDRKRHHPPARRLGIRCHPVIEAAAHLERHPLVAARHLEDGPVDPRLVHIGKHRLEAVVSLCIVEAREALRLLDHDLRRPFALLQIDIGPIDAGRLRDEAIQRFAVPEELLGKPVHVCIDYHCCLPYRRLAPVYGRFIFHNNSVCLLSYSILDI